MERPKQPRKKNYDRYYGREDTGSLELYYDSYSNKKRNQLYEQILDSLKGRSCG